MQYFETEKSKANTIQQLIDKTDKEIDEMVYQLYGLTEEERKVVEEG
jgi:type II restriction/modification system DNA methylase subunit YeeA